MAVSSDHLQKDRVCAMGVFFEKSKLFLQKWLILLHWWIREYPVTDAAEEAKVTETTAIQVYQYFRDIDICLGYIIIYLRLSWISFRVCMPVPQT